MISADVLEYGQSTRGVLSYKQGDIYAVFSESIYLRGGDSLCCLGLASLVNGPINIRTSLKNLPALGIGDQWRYQSNSLTLGQCCHCDTGNALLWRPVHKPALINSRGYDLCIREIEAALLADHRIDKVHHGATHTLIQQRLDHYQLLLATSLSSLGNTEYYVIPPQLIGLLGCGDGLTPAGDDILLGVLIGAIHFDQPRLYKPLIKWLTQHATDRTNQISSAHLMSATEGQAIETVHLMLNALSHRINNPDTPTGRSSAKTLQRSIRELLNHGQSSGYYTVAGVLQVLKYLSNSVTEQS